ncbi:hypothetical protein BH20ACT19_BH20ACT19_01860 [soil metagenome]
MVRTQVQLTEPQAERLRRLAADRGVSMAAVIREAVDAIPLREDADARWERAWQAVGCGASGIGDIASEHDRHLDKVFGGHVR